MEENPNSTSDTSESGKPKKKAVKTAKKKPKRKVAKKTQKTTGNINYPKHSFQKALRIPKAILDQNAGKECTEAEAAKFVGVGYTGPFQVEISSAKKYTLIERTGP